MRVISENQILVDPSTDEMQEYSNLFGRRKAAKAAGLKPGSKAFRQYKKGLRKADKGLNLKQKRAVKKTRKAEFNTAVSEGRVKRGIIGKIGQGVKKVIGAPVRNAFLLMVRSNIKSIASKLAILQSKSSSDASFKAKWDKVMGIFLRAGGSKDALLKAISVGSKRKPLLQRKKSGFEGFDGDEVDDIHLNIKGGQLAGAAGAVLVAGPIAIPILALLSGINTGGTEEEELVEDSDMLEEEGETGMPSERIAMGEEEMGEDGTSEEDGSLDGESGEEGGEAKSLSTKKVDEDKKKKMIKWAIIGGGLLVAAIITIVVVKKMKKK